MKRLIFSSIIMFFFHSGAVAQQGYYVDKDDRIAKFEHEILLFLIHEKEFQAESKSSKLEDYQGRMIVKKRLGIFSDSSANNLLLIQFRAASDHGDLYWGILSRDEKYFFYSTKDSAFLSFKNKYRKSIVDLVSFYLKQNKFE